MKKIVFENFNPTFVNELNSWQNKEKRNDGHSSLEEFVVPKGSLLGDFLVYLQNNIDDVSIGIALEDGKPVGFICTTRHTNEHLHIEIMGVNPDLRGKGYAGKMLEEFKSRALARQEITRLTLAVKKSNTAGIKSFSKVGKLSPEQPETNYISFEI